VTTTLRRSDANFGQRFSGSRFDTPAPPSFAQKRFKRQAEDRESERPLKALDGDLVHARLEIFSRQLGQYILVQGLESPSVRTQPPVVASGHARDGLQGVLVERGAHEGALLVANELAGLTQGNQLATLGPDADSVDVNPIGRRRACRIDSVAFQILAIGEKDQKLVVRGLVVQRRTCHLDGSAHVGTAARNGRGIDGIQGLLEHAAVQGERALQERIASEGHQAHAVALELRHQIANGELGAGKPIRFEIRRQHALRGVERKEQIEPAPVGLFPVHAPLRSRQGHAAEQCASDKECSLECSPHARQRRDRPLERELNAASASLRLRSSRTPRTRMTVARRSPPSSQMGWAKVTEWMME